MLYGWEGNRRSGVALAMRHRLSVISTYGLMALGRELSTPPKLYSEYYGTFTFTFKTVAPAMLSRADDGFLSRIGSRRVMLKGTIRSVQS